MKFQTFDWCLRETKKKLLSSVGQFVDLSPQKVEYKTYVFPSNLPALNYPLFKSVQNRRIDEHSSALIIFSFP